MRAHNRSRLKTLVVVGATALGALGCTNTVYKDFPGFQPPPTGITRLVALLTSTASS